MASYNEIDGAPSHASTWLLRTVLREEWGFNGYVVSDYYAIRKLCERPELYGHHVAHDGQEAAVLAVKAGVNFELPEADCYRHLSAAVAAGQIVEADLDALVAPVLAAKFALGLFEQPYAEVESVEQIVGCDAHRQLALEAARQTITLLENDGVLPLQLDKLKSIAVIGPNADRPLLGGYSGLPDVLEGIRAFVGERCQVLHHEGCKITIGGSWWEDEVVPGDPVENRRMIAEAVQIVAKADVAVLVVGGNEQTSRKAWMGNHLGDRTSLELVGEQNELVNALAGAGKPVISILSNGRPLAVTNLAEKSSALLECWYLGQEAGAAVAEVLFGDYNPGGKLPISGEKSSSDGPRKPNVLLIFIDDLNDWIEPLGGHPQTKTPNLAEFARTGVTFTRSYCQAPLCNASRISFLTGRYPSSTGIYYLTPYLRQCEATKTAVSLPQHFARSGYRTWGAGKVFHVIGEGEFQEFGGKFGEYGPSPPSPISFGLTDPLWDWGAYPAKDEEMPDHKIANWSARKLEEAGDEPFFLACGFYRPHVPNCVPQKWFDLHPLKNVIAPQVATADLMDVPAYAQDLTYGTPAPRHEWMIAHNEVKHGVQAYLASISFVDEQVGTVLKALERSGHADDTIVVIASDHGFHLGTKLKWDKRSLWEESCRAPLLMRVPKESLAGEKCERTVGLIDLYPTMIDVCGLSPLSDLEGRSLRPLLKEPTTPWQWPALTSFGQHNHSIRTERWRYITYADGSQELYDHDVDPRELFNLAGKPEHAGVIAELRKFLPQVNHVMAPGSSHADARPGSAADIDGPKPQPLPTKQTAAGQAAAPTSPPK